MSERERRGFWIAWALLAPLAVLPLWLGDFPPLVDLPQHAAQVSILRHWHDPACGFPELYEIHWFNPYWLGYALAWALAAAMPVATALRVVLSLAVAAAPFALLPALGASGGDRRWALLALPLAWGFPMAMGFFSFLVAVPLVLALLGPGLRYARSPSLARGLALGLGCAALFLVHVLALAAAGLMLAATVAAAAPSARELPRRLAPLLVALPAPLAWLALAPPADRTQRGGTLWLAGWDRLAELPVLVTGFPNRWLAAAVGAAILGVLAWSGARPARELARWAPLGVCALLVLATPNVLYGTGYVAPRFAVFLVPALLCALDAPARAAASPRRAWAVAALALLLCAGAVARFAGMAAEGRGLRAVLDAAPPGGRLLYLALDHDSRWAAEPVFLHSGQLYAVDRCGVAERSFARVFQIPVRFRPERVVPIPDLLEYMPYRFRWEKHGGDAYDLFLFRSAEEPAAAAFAGGEGRIAPLAHAGRWWLYANVAKRGAPGLAR